MPRLATIYLRLIAVLGLAAWVGAIAWYAPWDHFGTRILASGLVPTAAILLGLTVLSTLSPVPTRGGGHLSVGIAPLFAAIVFPLPPWMVMTLAALGTIDQRIPGRQIPWNQFLFNRGQFTLSFGIPSIVVTAIAGGAPPSATSMIVAALLIYLLNTGLMSMAIGLIRNVSVFAAARAALWSNALTWVGLPLIGILIARLLHAPRFTDQLVVFLLYGPLLIYRASIQ
ncbi:MAG TPA: hypothetical protein VET65_12165, partial [Candidatus Limnocylindrales bacterium]|nr:hypothetical protein [Candidatus Limnocylindrales bacterium]